MQIFARIYKDRLNIRLVRCFFVHLKVLWKYSGSYHFRFFWSTGDEMISWAQFVTRPEVGGDMRFSIQGVTVRGRKSLGFLVLVNLSSLPNLAIFFLGGKKPSAETTRSWGSHHGVDSDFGAYEGAHASWMPIRWVDDGPNLGEVLEDHLKITWPQHNQLKTMELISNVDGWTSYESRTLAGISSIADNDSDEWRLQEWPNPGKRAWWNMVN